MPKISIFHNVSKDANFGLNTVLRTSETRPENVDHVLELSDGRYAWRDLATARSERHELVWVFLYDAEWTGDHTDPCPLLAQAFERFNNGSGHEDPSYFARKLRSLSVGDVVMVNGDAYSCDPAGWSPVSKNDLRILPASEAEWVIRQRYELGPREQLSLTVPLAD
jgi:hypothetical protein